MKEKGEEESVSSVDRLVILPENVNRREAEKVAVVEAEVLAMNVEKLATWQGLALRKKGVVVGTL